LRRDVQPHRREDHGGQEVGRSIDGDADPRAECGHEEAGDRRAGDLRRVDGEAEQRVRLLQHRLGHALGDSAAGSREVEGRGAAVDRRQRGELPDLCLTDDQKRRHCRL